MNTLPEAITLQKQQTEREADHSSQSIAAVKHNHAWIPTPISVTSSQQGIFYPSDFSHLIP